MQLRREHYNFQETVGSITYQARGNPQAGDLLVPSLENALRKSKTTQTKGYARKQESPLTKSVPRTQRSESASPFQPAALFDRRGAPRPAELTRFDVGNDWRQIRRLERRGKWSHGSVDHDIAQIVQQLLCPVLGGHEVEQLRVLIDEVGVHARVEEQLILEHVQEKWNVGLRLQEKKARTDDTPCCSTPVTMQVLQSSFLLIKGPPRIF